MLQTVAVAYLEENVLMLQLLLALWHPHLLHDLGLQGADSIRQWHRHAQHLPIQLPLGLVLNDRNHNSKGDWACCDLSGLLSLKESFGSFRVRSFFPMICDEVLNTEREKFKEEIDKSLSP